MFQDLFFPYIINSFLKNQIHPYKFDIFLAEPMSRTFEKTRLNLNIEQTARKFGPDLSFFIYLPIENGEKGFKISKVKPTPGIHFPLQKKKNFRLQKPP